MWYLVGLPSYKNLSEAVEPLIARCQAEILAALPSEDCCPLDPDQPTISVAEWRPKTPAHVERVQQARRSGREARYQQALEWHKQGVTTKEIASRLRLGQRTVQRWLAAGSFQYKSSRRKRPSAFDAFAPYVLKRWKEGERNGLALWREIKERGYTGSDRSLYRYLQTLKQAEVKTVVEPRRIQKFSANSALWLFVREKDALEQFEQDDLAAWLDAHPTLAQAYKLIQDFLVMVHKREGHKLDAWLQQVKGSSISELQSFASGVERDKAAVRAGLTQSTNNGMVEGFVTKVKLIKGRGMGGLHFLCFAIGCFMLCRSMRGGGRDSFPFSRQVGSFASQSSAQDSLIALFISGRSEYRSGFLPPSPLASERYCSPNAAKSRKMAHIYRKLLLEDYDLLLP